MPSRLILDPQEPGISDVIANAAVGTPLVLREMTVVPTSISETSFEADVGAITVDQAEPPPAEADQEMAQRMASMPKGGVAPSGSESVY